MEFSRRIFEKYAYFMKMCQMEAELFHAGGQTDGRTNMTKLIVAFGNFAYAPKKFGLMTQLYMYILSSYLVENNFPSTLQYNL